MVSTQEDLASRWLKGLMEACVLGVLQRGPAYGYEIASWFESAGFSRPKGGSLYPILTRLEKSSLVEPTWVEGDGGPGRKYYGLTPAGVAAAEAATAEWGVFTQRIAWLVAGRTAEEAS